MTSTSHPQQGRHALDLVVLHHLLRLVELGIHPERIKRSVELRLVDPVFADPLALIAFSSNSG